MKHERSSELDLVTLLSKLHVDKSPHTGRSLLDHLRGTQELLEAWENPRAVCLAGLFHSVYATQSYKHQSVTYSRRELIRRAIGTRAERLAYLFCVAERSKFFDQSIKSRPRLYNRISGRTVPVAPKSMRALAEIEVANYVEFLPRTTMSKFELQEFCAKIRSAKGALTSGAYRAALQSLRSKSKALRLEAAS